MRSNKKLALCGLLPGLAHAFVAYVCFAQGAAPSESNLERTAAELHTRIESSPALPFHSKPLLAVPPVAGWTSGSVSGIAVGADGTIYEIQRGSKGAPVLVLNSHGQILRSWGEGQFVIPHSIRLDPEGNVWTVDAASSKIVKYSPSGRRLMMIDVGGQPDNGSLFDGTTDIAFGPDGRLFITDGYGNARVLQYTAAGKRVREWGKRGSGPGELNLPHSLQIADGILYVADRENGRIEEFDLAGRYQGEIANLGRVYSIKIAGDAIWASMGPFDQPPGAAGGWVVKLDRRTGKMMGHLDVPEAGAGHALEVTHSGEPIITSGDGLRWFKANR